MADKQITQLSATTSPLASGDLIVIEKADGSGTKKMTYNEFIKAVSATMLTQSGAVTDSLHAVNAKELNASLSGTVAAKISTLDSRTAMQSFTPIASSNITLNWFRCMRNNFLCICEISFTTNSNISANSTVLSGLPEIGGYAIRIVASDTGSTSAYYSLGFTGGDISVHTDIASGKNIRFMFAYYPIT